MGHCLSPFFQEKLVTLSFIRKLSHSKNINHLLNIFKQCCMCQTKHIQDYPWTTFAWNLRTSQGAGGALVQESESHIVKSMVFPVVMYGCESWTMKKAEHHRIDAFEPWCWRRLLGVSWTARRSNQSILKETNPEYSLEGLMLKLKCQYFSHLIRRANSLEKNLMLGKIEGRRRRGWQRMTWLDGITESMGISLSKL